MKFTYTTIDRVMSKLYRDYDITPDEGDVIEWAGEALSGIGAAPQYEEAVAFIEVANHQCALPANFHKIVQIAKNNLFNPQDKPATGLCANIVIDSFNPLETPAPSCPIVLDCQGQPIQEYDLAYYRPYFDLQYEYYGWAGKNSLYTACFSPVRAATSSFSSLVCEEQDEHIKQLYQASKHEYSLIANSTLRFDFRDGQVAVAFLRNPVDAETGYPLIPDNYSYLEALCAFIAMKLHGKDYFKGREGAEGRMKKAEENWQWYCQQSKGVALMPNGVDDFEDLMQASHYLIPRTNEYNNFFGRLGNTEQRRFNNSDYRNKTRR